MPPSTLGALPQLTVSHDIGMGMDMSDVMAKLDELGLQIDTVTNQVPFGHHTLAPDGTFLSINALEQGWLGQSSEDLVGTQKFSDFLTPASRVRFQDHFTHPLRHGVIDDLELDLLAPDGRTRPISLSSHGIQNDAGHIIKHRAMCFDLTLKKQTEHNQRMAAMAFESLSGMFVTDSRSVILHVNQSFCTITGYSAAEAVGQTPAMLSSGQHGRAFYEDMWEQLLRTNFWQGEVINRRKNGGLYTEWMSISGVNNAAGTTTHYLCSFIDITSHKRAEDAIHKLAFFDPLTHLANRRLLKDRMAQAIASARLSGQNGAVLMVDLDNFKMINDTCGHDAGDGVLTEVAARLQCVVQRADCVARLGGDEFVVVLALLPGNPLEAMTQAQHTTDNILAILGEPYEVMGQSFRCTASIGIDLFGDSNSVSDLLKHADLAMYQAKKSGRNTLRFFDAEMQAAMTSRVELEQALRQGLEQRQFVLYFQPQVDDHDRIVGAEVLLRWQHPQRGLVSPLEFIPLAEETGLILPIGQWVLESACAQLKAWETHPLACTLQLAVNVSASQFNHTHFVDQVEQAVRRSGIRPDRLKLELTESMVFSIDDTVQKMHALKALGVTFSMDDFGTGYSSLSNLTRLPLSQLKIDQSFVRNMGTQPADAAIVQTIIAMAHNLGLDVIAEGVETPAQRSFLSAHGCGLYQGYLFGHPLPLDEFEADLRHLLAPEQAHTR